MSIPSSSYSANGELARQIEIENRFFRRNRPSSRKHTSTQEKIRASMHEVRTGSGKNPIAVTDVPARIVVIAENCINHLCFGEKNSDSFGYIATSLFKKDSSIPRISKSLNPLTTSPKIYDTWFAPIEVVEFSHETDVHTVSYKNKVYPHKNHKGDHEVVGIGAYYAINDQLRKLTKENRDIEKNLARLLLDFPRKICKISAQQLENAIQQKPSETEVKFINNLCYLLFVKEIARRQAPADESHDLPWATGILRAIELVAHGHLQFSDVLKLDAKYGVSTGKDIGRKMDPVIEKFHRINKLYWEHFNPPSTQRSQNPEQLATSRTAHKALLSKYYGGASDTESEGYESPSM